MSNRREPVVPESHHGTPIEASEAFLETAAAWYKTWIMPHLRIVIGIVIAILLGVALAKSIKARHSEHQGQAFAALATAEDAESLLAVAGKFGDTPAGPRAQLEAARTLYDDGKYEQAVTKFELARKVSAAVGLDTASSLGEAYALEAAGKNDIAEKRFADLAQRAPGNAIVVDCWLGAGRAAKNQGKLAEAEKFYLRAKEMLGDDRFAQQRVDGAMGALKAARYATRPAPVTADTDDDSAPAAVDSAPAAVVAPAE